MQKDDLDDDERILNEQIELELKARGLTGVPWEDIPNGTFEEALAAAKKNLGGQ